MTQWFCTPWYRVEYEVDERRAFSVVERLSVTHLHLRSTREMELGANVELVVHLPTEPLELVAKVEDTDGRLVVLGLLAESEQKLRDYLSDVYAAELEAKLDESSSSKVALEAASLYQELEAWPDALRVLRTCIRHSPRDQGVLERLAQTLRELAAQHDDPFEQWEHLSEARLWLSNAAIESDEMQALMRGLDRDLRTLRDTIGSGNAASSQQTLDAYEKQIGDLTRQLSSAERKRIESEKALTSSRRALSDAKGALSKSENAWSSEIEALREELESERATAQERLRGAKDELHRVSTILDDARSKNTDMEERLAATSRREDELEQTLKSTIAEYESRLAEEDGTRRDAIERATLAESRSLGHEQQSVQQLEQINVLQKELEASQAQADTLATELSQASAREESEKDQRATLEAELQAAREQLGAEQQARSTGEYETRRVLEALTESTETVEQLKGAIAEAERRADSAEAARLTDRAEWQTRLKVEQTERIEVEQTLSERLQATEQASGKLEAQWRERLEHAATERADVEREWVEQLEAEGQARNQVEAQWRQRLELADTERAEAERKLHERLEVAEAEHDAAEQRWTEQLRTVEEARDAAESEWRKQFEAVETDRSDTERRLREQLSTSEAARANIEKGMRERLEAAEAARAQLELQWQNRLLSVEAARDESQRTLRGQYEIAEALANEQAQRATSFEKRLNEAQQNHDKAQAALRERVEMLATEHERELVAKHESISELQQRVSRSEIAKQAAEERERSTSADLTAKTIELEDLQKRRESDAQLATTRDRRQAEELESMRQGLENTESRLQELRSASRNAAQEAQSRYSELEDRFFEMERSFTREQEAAERRQVENRELRERIDTLIREKHAEVTELKDSTQSELDARLVAEQRSRELEQKLRGAERSDAERAAEAMQLRAQLKAIKDEAAQLHTELDDARAEASQHCQALAERNSGLEQRLEDERAQLQAEIESERAAHRRTSEQAENEQKRADTSLAALEAELQSLRLEHENTQATLTSFERTSAALVENERKAHEATLAKLDAVGFQWHELSTLQDEVEAEWETLSRYRAQLEELSQPNASA